MGQLHPTYSRYRNKETLYIARNRAFTPNTVKIAPPPQWVDPGFANDVVQGRDLLDVRGDAAALAVLLGSSSLNPPLALGLYGEWGSGKTFFMRSVERELRSTERGAIGRCRNVASVWFNAWQYAESNLWASLIDHVFRSLCQDKMAPERELDAALAKVEGARHAKSGAKAEATAAERDAAAAKKVLAQVEAAHREAIEKAEQVQAHDVWAAISVDKDLGRDLNDTAKQLGLDPIGDSARDLVDTAREVRETVTHGRKLALAGAKWKSPLVLCLAAAAAAVLLSILIGSAIGWDHAWLKPLITLAGAVAAWGSGAAAWIDRQSTLARQLLLPGQRVEKQIDSQVAAQKEADRVKLQTARKHLHDTEAKLEAAKAKFAEATERETAAHENFHELTGIRLLERFLSDRAASTDYKQYLGPIALARRDLCDLDDYLRAATSVDDKDPIDRIVLYIDDLDRCPPAMVARVLEAVHLLLSLPLFVAIVGVDPAWLVRSIRDHHPQLAPSQDESDATSDGASPADYLDKIFQLTYRLPQMTPEQCAELLEHTALNTQPVLLSEAPAPDKELTGTVTIAGQEPLAPDTPASSVEVDPKPEIVSVGAEALILSEEELKTLRSIAPLVGSSPRKAKRFLNIYRIMKARALTDPDTYSRSTDSLIVLTALCVGLPDRIPAVFDETRVFGELAVGDWLTRHGASEQWSASETSRLAEFTALAGPLLELPIAELVQWLPIARRFAWPVY